LSDPDDIPLAIKDWDQVEQNPFFCADADKLEALDELMRGLKKEGDSIGAKVTVVADGVPQAGASRYLTVLTPISPTR
jgi:chorismate synthase